jgi:uncharacterized OB-fold protein
MSEALPDTDFAPTRGFWAAAARGELAVPRCASCRRYVWYPRDVCPGCGGREMPWERVSGRGTLFSWARVERALFAPFAGKVPYVAALVALEEDPGVRIVTNIVDCQASDLAVDMPVRVVFRDLAFEGAERRVRAPFFAPDRSRP